MVCILIVYLTVPPQIFTPPSEITGNAMAANSTTRLLKLVLLGVSALLIAKNFQVVKRLFSRINPFFRIFLVLVPASALWSIDRSATLARYASILTIVAVSVAFCSDQWHPQRFQKVVRLTITLLLIGSVIFVIVNPSLALQYQGKTMTAAWHGLAAQKNPFGDLASFGTILWLHAGLSRQVRAWKAVLGGGLAAFCIVMSHSATALIATVFVAIFLLMLMRPSGALRRYMPYLVSLFAALVLTYALAVLNLVPGSDLLLKPITLITGKSMTFSNRTAIWQIIEQHIHLSPLLGSGYGAYWIGPVPSSPSYVFIERMNFYPTESHNGYLEIVNDLGYVGLVCLLGYLFFFVRQSLYLMRFDRAEGALFLALFCQQAIENLAESCWLAINSGFIFGIITLATIALARSLMERNSQARRMRPGAARRPPPANRRAPWLARR